MNNTRRDEGLRSQIMRLRQEIFETRVRREPKYDDYALLAKEHMFSSIDSLKARRTLINKNLGEAKYMSWGNDLNLVTVTAGAKDVATCIVWDANTGDKNFLIEPENSWSLCVCMEKTRGEYVGIGGMSSTLAVYRLENNADDPIIRKPEMTLSEHDGYIQTALFCNGNQALSAGGDGVCKLWDLEKQSSIYSFSGHTSDVNALALPPQTDHCRTFISGSCDFTARMWDVRERQKGHTGLQFTFDTKSRDVLGVNYFPDGNAFIAALSDSRAVMFDLRSSCKVCVFNNVEVEGKFKCQDAMFSRSGRLLFARYDGGKAYCYDVTRMSPVVNKPGSGLEARPVSRDTPGTLCNSAVVERLHKDKAQVVGMAIQADGACLAISDSKLSDATIKDTIVRLFWPKQGHRR